MSFEKSHSFSCKILLVWTSQWPYRNKKKSYFFPFTGVTGCILVAPVMVHIIGCKWTMLVSGTMLLLWVLSGVVPTSQSSYVTALLTGLATGPLFTALATQLARNARQHAAFTDLPVNTCIARFCGIFFAMLHLGE